MRKWMLLIAIFVFSVSIYAGGRKDNETRTAENPEGFSGTINIEDKKPGKWNIYVEAQDKGGNTAITGPYNIYIDPESDLPIARIINPMPNMHVQGNLNIVGTCIDDDGVSYVEFIITRGSDGKGEVMLQTRADGAEFWSYSVDTSDTTRWRDGVYTITAWGVDINGLSGISDQFPAKSHKKYQVSWNLDRKKPDIKVTSHELGALLSGKVNIRGTVWDGNGVDSLSYSLDNGIRYQSASLKYDKNNDIYSFDISVDTKIFDDGPAVIMFRAKDKMKTEGAYSFLIFANNTGPEIEILYPDLDEPVNGIFTIAGYAAHGVGLSSLKWKLGKDSGEIPMIIGNPWWVQEFDIRGQNVRELDLEFQAMDVSGNTTTIKRKLKVDQEADLPIVSITEPIAGTIVSSEGLSLIGYASDNEGVQSILYSLNGAPAVEVPCSGFFQLTITDILPGIAMLEVWAKDITDVVGRKTLVKDIFVPGMAPEPKIANVRTGSRNAEVTEFYSGIEINSETDASLDLVINSGSPIQSISYQLGSKPPVNIQVRSNRGGEYLQNIPIPADIDFGQVGLEIRVKDTYDRETVLEEYIRITDLTSQRILDGYVPLNRLRDRVITLKGLNNETSWPAQITIARGARNPIPISASVDPGNQPSRMTFTIPGISPINGTFRNDEIQANLPADLPAGLVQVTLAVETRTGESYEVAGEFWLLRPRTEGQAINTSESFTWVRPEEIAGNRRILLSTTEPLLGLYNGRPLQSVRIEGEASNNLDARVDAYGRVALTARTTGDLGPVRLVLTDRDGKTYYTQDYNFLAAGPAPVLNWITDPENQWVQNQFQVNFRIQNVNKIKSVEYSSNMGVLWQPLLQSNEADQYVSGTVIEKPIDIATLPNGTLCIKIRITDEANLQTVRSFLVYKDTEAPKAQLVVPINGARVHGMINLGFTITEAGKLATVFYERPEVYVPGNDESEGYTLPALSGQVYPKPGAGSDDRHITFLEILTNTLTPLDENMRFIFTDEAGNQSVLSYWPFIHDEEMDLPVVQISLPLENEVISSDFVVSGICYDDDAVAKIYWQIDDRPVQELDARFGFSIPISLSSLTDNDHSVTIYAEDIYLVKGKPVTRNFRVSLEEPKAAITAPKTEEIIGGSVGIAGTAFDLNGISKIQVSLDNGNSYNDAVISDEDFYRDETRTSVEWSYQFNSKILPDGNHAVFVRVYDEYDINALYSCLINIDNTPPELTVYTPRDGAETTGPLYFTGQVMDNMMLDSVSIRLSSLDGVAIPPYLEQKNAKLDALLLDELDLSTLPDGDYNVEVWAVDKAGNTSRTSRNIILVKGNQRNYIDILYPLGGQYMNGNFNIYGYVGGIDTASQVTLMVNGATKMTEPVTSAGYFRFSIDPENMSPGTNTISVRSDFDGKGMVESGQQEITYSPYGPWVTVDTLNMGDFAYERPWLMGRAGYVLTGEDQDILADRRADREIRDAAEAKKVSSIELSYDNGRTYFPAGKGREKAYDWSFRLETQDMAEGIHFLMVRATMANGEIAVTRLLIQVDKTQPVIRLISPEPGGHYNTELEFTALTSDDVELGSVNYYLRQGDMAFYEVPGFIKGLYFEVTIPPFIKQIWNGAPSLFAGGATYMDVSMGLSFFDDNVKIQAGYGIMTQDIYNSLGGNEPLRYGGHVLGLKLLANVYQLPFASFLGPDWDWLSATFALGANFSLFDLGSQGYTQSGSPTWMSALLAQIEFPRITIPKRTYLRTFSLFTEGQLWFVPTDVNASAYGISTVIPHVILGLRMYIF